MIWAEREPAALRAQIQEKIERGKDPTSELTSTIREDIRARYAFAAQFIKPQDNILDIGCGFGFELKRLTPTDVKRIWAIDLFRERAKKASKNNRQYSNIQVSQMDAINLGFRDQCFDKVVAMEVIEHIPDYPEMLVEVCRVLKDEGILILSTPNFDVTKQIIFEEHVREFTKEELERILQTYFGKIEFWGLRRSENVFSGAYSQARQSPLYALYQALPASLRSLVQYPLYRLCYGKPEVRPFDPQQPSPILVILCREPKRGHGISQNENSKDPNCLRCLVEARRAQTINPFFFSVNGNGITCQLMEKTLLKEKPSQLPLNTHIW